MLGRLLGVLALALVASSPVGAQPYPSRLIKIIVPFGAGGPADVYARAVGQQLSASLKQNVIVENRPGAGALIGTTEAAKAEPDGYTLLMMSNTHTVNETLVARKGYELLRDFVPVAPVNASDLLVAVHPSVPARTVAELIALAKSKPGELNYASSGVGTPYHMAGELFKAMTGTNIVHVPHRGSGEARNNLIGGHVQLMIDAVTTMAPNVAAGQVRGLATTGDKRSPLLPGTPAVAETVPGYEATIWLGLMAPKSTPKEIVDRLNEAVTAAVSGPELAANWAKQGAAPLTMSPGEFERYVRADIAKWKAVIETAGIRPD